MKTTPLITLLIACLLTLSISSFGQAAKCVILVPDMLSLIGADQAKLEKVLKQCFQFESMETLDKKGKVKTIKYRRDYKESEKSDWVDYDVFHVYLSEKTIALSTTNYNTYQAYKLALKEHGFLLKDENTKSSIYKFQKYKMETLSSKNASHKLTYNIFISL